MPQMAVRLHLKINYLYYKKINIIIIIIKVIRRMLWPCPFFTWHPDSNLLDGRVASVLFELTKISIQS